MPEKSTRFLMIEKVRPVVFFIGEEGNLRQGIDILVENKKDPARANIEIKFGLKKENVDIEEVRKEKKAYRIYLPEIQERVGAEFILFTNGKVQNRRGE